MVRYVTALTENENDTRLLGPKLSRINSVPVLLNNGTSYGMGTLTKVTVTLNKKFSTYNTIF